MKLITPRPRDVSGKRVLVRVDFNVPLTRESGSVKVVDDRRIRASIELIRWLVEQETRVILLAHLGRPSQKHEEKFSLAPVAEHAGKVLKQHVAFAEDCVGPQAEAAIQKLKKGQILLLENVRFHEEEQKNEQKFSQGLAKLADVYIDDSFSTAHRAHASTEGVAHFLPSFAGPALAREVEALSRVRDNPRSPFVVIIGGAKISDKVDALVKLSEKADVVLIGGGVANTFLKAEGYEIHKSYLEDTPADLKKKGVNYVQVAEQIADQWRTEHVWKNQYVPLPKVLYPLDVVAAPSPESTHTQVVDLSHAAQDTPKDKNLMYLDIGPRTTKLYCDLIASAKTIFWNGPMGYWEKTPFAFGTHQVGQAISGSKAYSVAGGGDTLAAIDRWQLGEGFEYLSTAGGASLEFLAGKELPGLAILTQ